MSDFLWKWFVNAGKFIWILLFAYNVIVVLLITYLLIFDRELGMTTLRIALDLVHFILALGFWHFAKRIRFT